MLNIVVLVSGGGTNLQAIIDAQNSLKIKNGKIAGVISSKDGVFALERARLNGIPAMVISKKDLSPVAFDKVLLATLEELKADLIVLAGFMTILSADIITKFENKIINVHPALIPSFCGKGFYGLKVHQAVLDYGVKLTGATVHFVNQAADDGAIILQKSIPVLQDDTAETLQKRVMEQTEWELLPKAIDLFCDGKLKVCGRTVLINE